MTLNKYKVTLQSFLFRYTYEVVASNEEKAIQQVMEIELAPRRCFTAKFIKNIYTSED